MASSTLPVAIERVTKPDATEVEQIKATLAAAFDQDQFTSVVTDGDHEFVGGFWYSVVVAGLLGGEVYVAKGENNHIIGVAVWFPPGREMYDSEDQQKQALGILTGRFSESLNAWWTTKFLPKYDEAATESFGEGKKLSSWHLQAIGVHPEHQRKGIARAFVETIRKKAAADKVDMVLEAQREVNVEIYKKLGFVVKGETVIEGATGSASAWYMLKEVV